MRYVLQGIQEMQLEGLLMIVNLHDRLHVTVIQEDPYPIDVLMGDSVPAKKMCKALGVTYVGKEHFT